MPKPEPRLAPAAPAPSPVERTATRLLQWVQEQALAPGAALPARQIGDALGLSRFPVQQALARLEEQGFTARPTGRGYVLKATRAALKKHLALAARGQPPSPYMAIARDRLRGALPKELTEMELARRYGLTRMQVGPILHRMAQEGWVQRKSGHGWLFTEMIDSPQSHENAYVFRMAIEPAALLAPTFRTDAAALQRLRAEQAAMRDGRLGRISGEELFEISARFHQTLVGFSRNEFFIGALERVNQRRRLVEYEAMARPADFLEQCHEHLALLDLVERGQRKEAAAFLRRHLDIVRAVKLQQGAAVPKGAQEEVQVHF